MPNRAGRLTNMERAFVANMARTNDAKYSAAQAGYKHPGTVGPRVAAIPAIQDATFAEVQRFLKNQGAAIGVYTLANIAVDENAPMGVRRAAASDLAKLSGVGVEDQANGKELHEMSAAELAANADKLERQRQAMLKALSDQAKPIVDASEGDVFG
jgi:hypothetical protein